MVLFNLISTFSMALWICVSSKGTKMITRNSTELSASTPLELTLKSTNRIPTPKIAKCCADNELYYPGFDLCINVSSDVHQHLEPLPVYSSIDSESVLSITVLPLESRQLFAEDAVMDPCSDGYYSTSTEQFELFFNGSLKTNNGLHKAGQFCIHPAPAANKSGNNQWPLYSYVARYCIPHQCDSATCIRKCCPEGMAFNEKEKICQPTDSPFAIVKYMSTDSTDSITEALSHDNTIRVKAGRPTHQIISGLHISCSTEGLIEVFLNEFYILSDGKMYVPSYPCEFERSTDQYCIENLYNGNASRVTGLRCFPKIFLPNVDTKSVYVTGKIYPYVQFVSVMFLVVSFCVYALLPEMRNTHGMVVMCYIASMTVLYIGLGMIQLNMFRPIPNIPSSKACNALGVVVHFSFLSTFSWLHVICFDIWWTFRCALKRALNSNRLLRREYNSFFVYSIFGWGLPLSIVVAGQMMDLYVTDENIIRPGFGKFECWFICWESFMVYLYGPAAVMIMMNIVFFLTTTLQLYRAREESALALRNHVSNQQLIRQRTRVFLNLFILMGVSWMTEVISFTVGGSEYRWIMTDIVNIFMGVFIFFIFICKPKVWNLLTKRFPHLLWLEISLPCCRKIRSRKSSSSRITINSLGRSRASVSNQQSFRFQVRTESTSLENVETLRETVPSIETSWPIPSETSFIQRNVTHYD